MSIDLNMEKRIIYRIIRFYKVYPIVVSVMRQSSIVYALHTQLSWQYHIILANTKVCSFLLFF